MDKIDYTNIEQLNSLYDSLNDIRLILNEYLDEEALVNIELYKEIANCNIKSNLGERGLLVELTKSGKGELVKKYIEIEKEVSKAKNTFKQALEAINLKKHMNNLTPR